MHLNILSYIHAYVVLRKQNLEVNKKFYHAMKSLTNEILKKRTCYLLHGKTLLKSDAIQYNFFPFKKDF